MAKWGLFVSVILIVLALFLAAGNFTYYSGDPYWSANKAGFFTGIIHGILSPMFLVAQIFSEYTMYELNNNGWWYNFGFLLGILLVWGSGSTGGVHVVKNYYGMSRADKTDSTKAQLSEEDHDMITKTIEEKIDSKLGKTSSRKKAEKK